jgi:hypothetical protein
MARERTGYPSQKPQALLERLVGALSNRGDLVLDPYAGSGTTLAAAHALGRGFLGIDESRVAIETARARLDAQGAPLLERSSPDSEGAPRDRPPPAPPVAAKQRGEERRRRRAASSPC